MQLRAARARYHLIHWVVLVLDFRAAVMGGRGGHPLSTRCADFVGPLSTTHNVTHKQVTMNVVLLASLCCRKKLIPNSQHVKPAEATLANIVHKYISIN